MTTQRAIPILRTIINDQMDLYLVLKNNDIELARYYTRKISADMERISDFLGREAKDGKTDIPIALKHRSEV